MEGDLPSESLSEYCLKLGLQVRDNESTKMTVDSDSVAENAEETDEVRLENEPKASYDCKNCSKGFTNSRQLSKHRCSSTVIPEEECLVEVLKGKRGPKTKSTRNTSNGGKAINKSSTAVKELERFETHAETTPESTSQEEIDDGSTSVGHLLIDHTYIRDEIDGDVEGSSNQVVGEESGSKESGSELTSKNIVQCELCSMLPIVGKVSGSDDASQELACEKCLELAANSINQAPTSEEPSNNETVSEKKSKKRRSTVKKPGELCPHCKKAFSYEKCLAKHLKVCKKNEDNTAKVQCELCSMMPPSDDPDSGSTEKPPCEKCKEASTASKDPSLLESPLDGEVSQIVKKRKYIFRKPEEFCPHCKKGFHSEKRLERHMRVCGKDLVCEFCGEDFNTGAHNAYSKYEDHYYTHIDEKPFPCTVCSKGFVRKQDLNKHQIIHTEEYSPQECLVCGGAFASVELLQKHTRKHERPTWSCPKCSRLFVRQALYKQHILICQKEISCEICGKVFHCLTKNIKYRYQEHMFIHTGEKPYKCQHCEHAFRDRSTRKKHERTHTGEKPYQCTMCVKAFSQLKLLRNHVFTHTGEKPFGCELCKLRFAKQCNLKYHMRVHTKEKPYTCELCHKSFTQSGTYYKHMRRHESNQTTKVISVAPASNEEDTAMVKQEEITADENAVNTVLIQDMPIATDEITIIVSEGNGVATSMGTINVDHISSILASCS